MGKVPREIVPVSAGLTHSSDVSCQVRWDFSVLGGLDHDGTRGLPSPCGGHHGSWPGARDAGGSTRGLPPPGLRTGLTRLLPCSLRPAGRKASPDARGREINVSSGFLPALPSLIFFRKELPIPPE